MCWLRYTNIAKQNTIQTRTFLLRDRKNVSISILFQKVFLRWKISGIINRIDGRVGTKIIRVEKIEKLISAGRREEVRLLSTQK